MKKTIVLCYLLISVLFVHAQDSTPIKNKWSFFVEPYLMFPSMSGDMGLGNLPDVPVDANPGDILSHLQMGAMLHVEARTNKWSIASDVLYMKLKQDATPGNVINYGNATVQQTAWELAGLYKINSWLEAGAGARLNNIGADVEVNHVKPGIGESITETASITETWVDPILITRVTAPLKGKWLLQVRADMGGFGVGSKFAWQVQADAGYKFSKLFQATIGYRYMEMNYSTGSDSDRFLYDMAILGPTVRFGFSF
ncbi:MAG: hypothetical protein ABL895_16195 [Cyclobacteriaceae bacterium]